jgi:hypothetical protein
VASRKCWAQNIVAGSEARVRHAPNQDPGSSRRSRLEKKGGRWEERRGWWGDEGVKGEGEAVKSENRRKGI